jgi:hypothetical protein
MLAIAKGDMKNIVDPRLHENFKINSAWKAVEIAMECVYYMVRAKRGGFLPSIHKLTPQHSKKKHIN